MNAAADVAVLIGTEDIAAAVDRLARTIAAAEAGDLLVVVILKGSFVFAADLIRALERAGLSP